MRKIAAFTLAFAISTTPALAGGIQLTDTQLDAITAGRGFQVIDLVSNQPGVAANFDPSLVNPWGISHGPGTAPLWVSDNGSDSSTVYNRRTGQKIPLTVAIAGGAPTGQVFSADDKDGDADFAVHSGGKSGNAAFIFATESGKIDGWSPSVDPTHAVVAVDQAAQGSVFKGLTIAPHRELLFAADFINNAVDVFNDRFQRISTFTDPALPAAFAPFNVQVLDGRLYVTFAERQPGSHDEAHGAGLGYVDVFNMNGHLEHRLVSGGPLNAPWGMTIAPASFGKFAGALLVGNFGDGSVNAFDRDTGKFLGQLTSPDGSPLHIDGLWALQRGPNGSVTFTAGPNDESNGLLGTINAAQKSMVSWQTHSKGTAMTGMAAISRR